MEAPLCDRDGQQHPLNWCSRTTASSCSFFLTDHLILSEVKPSFIHFLTMKIGHAHSMLLPAWHNGTELSMPLYPAMALYRDTDSHSTRRLLIGRAQFLSQQLIILYSFLGPLHFTSQQSILTQCPIRNDMPIRVMAQWVRLSGFPAII